MPPIMTIASTTGKSFVVTLWMARYPRPGQEKMVSVMAAPASRLGSVRPSSVMTGSNAFFRACLNTTRDSARPLALAVRM